MGRRKSSRQPAKKVQSPHCRGNDVDSLWGGMPPSPKHRGYFRPNPYPIAAFTLAKAATANSKSSRLWTAETCVRMRALPCGTTGYEKPIT